MNQLVAHYRAKYPDAAKGMSDDDITLKYATEADRFKASGTDLFATYPDFAADFERVRTQRISDSLTVGDYVRQVGRSTVRGVAGVLGAVPPLAAATVRKVTDGDIDLEDEARVAVDSATEALSPAPNADPAKQAVLDQSFWATKVPQGVGSVGGFVAAGGAGGLALRAAGVGAAAAGTASVAGMGFATGFDEQYREALRSGASREEAFQAGLLGGGVGTSEVVPLAKWLDRLSVVVPGGADGLRQIIRETGRETVEEALQEAFQSGAGDIIARNVMGYDKSRELFSGMAEDAAVGGVTGLLFSLLTQGVSRVRRDMLSPGVDKTAPGPAAPEATLTTKEEPAGPAQEIVRDMQEAYEIDVRGLNELLAREMSEGSDAVAAEKVALSPDALRLYNIKLSEARLAKLAAERDAAAKAATENAGAGEAGAEEVPEVQPPVPAPTSEAPPAPPAAPAPAVEAVPEKEKLDALLTALDKADGGATIAPPEPTPAAISATPEVQPVPPGDAAVAPPPPATVAPPEPVVEPAVVAPPPPAPPLSLPERLGKQIQTFATENTGSDSREFLDRQVGAVEEQGKLFGAINAVLEVANKRVEDEAAKGTKAPLLTAKEMEALESLKSENVKAARLPLLLAKVKSGQASPKTLLAFARSAAGLQADALNRVAKLKTRVGSLGTGPIKAEDLLNYESINYAPDDGGTGYYLVGDKAPESAKLTRLVAQLEQSEKRGETLNEIGSLLSSGSRVRESRAATRRLAIWKAPDGGVVVTSAYDNSFRKKGEAEETNPDKLWRYSIGPSKRGAHLKKGATELDTGLVGIGKMVEAGFTPIGSIALATPRGRVALRFDSTEAFAQFVGEAAAAQQANVRDRFAAFEESVGQMAAEGAVDPETGEKPEVAETPESVASSALEWLLDNPELTEAMLDYASAHPKAKAGEILQKFEAEILARMDTDGYPDEVRALLQIEIEPIVERFAVPTTRDIIRNEIAKRLETTPAPATPSGESGGGGESYGSGSSGSSGAWEIKESQSEAPAPSAPESDARLNDPLRKEKDAALKKLAALASDDFATESDIDDGISDIEAAETPQEILEVLADVKAAIEDRKPEAADDLDLDEDEDGEDDDGSFRLLPESVEAVSYNIGRFTRQPKMSPSRRGLLGNVSEAQLQGDYGNLPDALRRIADLEKKAEAGQRKTIGGIRPAALLAEAFLRNVTMTGVTMRLVNNPNLRRKDGRAVLGRYDASVNQITINLAFARDLSDLHQTILHEVLHAYVDRMDIRFDAAPQTLSYKEREILSQLRDLVAMAKAAGLTWQDSDSGNGRVSFREFVTAAMTDPEFQQKLAGVHSPLTTASPETTIWATFKKLVSRLMSGLIRLYSELGLQVGEAQEQSMLDGSLDLIGSLVENYNQLTGSLDAGVVQALQTGTDKVSYREVDGLLLDSRDISVDASTHDLATTEAMMMMATTNEIAATYDDMLREWNAATGGTRTPSELVQGMVRRAMGARMQAMPNDVRTAIQDALTNQGASAVSSITQLSDLDQRGAAPKAAKDALTLLRRLEGGMADRKKKIEDVFAKGRLIAQIAETNTELFDLTKNYKDITVTSREFVKELRRGINETAEVGAYSIAKALGVVNPKAKVDAAIAKMQANVPTYTDSLQGLADLGLDYAQLKRGGSLTPAGVQAAVAASTDPQLASLRANPEELAVALMFARRRPLVMYLLRARKAGVERAVLDNIMNIAISNRPDAFDLASKELPKLMTLGKVAQQILTELRDVKDRNKKLIDTATEYGEFLRFFPSAMPVLRARIRSLEGRLALEASAAGDQWAAVNGARYYVPETDADPEEKVFSTDKTNAGYKELRLGDSFDAVTIREDIGKMRSWLQANRSLEGSSNYQLMRRQSEKLIQVYGDAANHQIQRGPGGWVVRVLGDIATQAEFLGVHSGRVFAQQIRRFNALYDAHLKGPEIRGFHTFDRYLAEAMAVTKVKGEDFLERFYDRAFAFLEARQDIIDPTLSFEDQLDVSINEAIGELTTDPAWTPAAEEPLTRMLKQAVRNNMAIQSVRQQMGLKVKDKIAGKVVFREPIGHPAHTMSRGVSGRMRGLVRGKMATKASWESEISPGVTSLEAGQVTDLYKNNRAHLASILAARFTPEVIQDFVTPLVEKAGASNFFGPEFSGIKDRAERRNVMAALHTAGNDMIRFAEELHAAEGGTAESLPDFVGQTMATFQRYYNILNNTLTITGASTDDAGVVGRAFLDAREGEDFPAEWLSYRRYGHADNVRYVRILALTAAFGQEGKGASENLARAKEELSILREEYVAAMKEKNAANRDALLNAGGLKRARMDAERNLKSLGSITESYFGMQQTLAGAPIEEQTFMQVIGSFAGLTVQGVMTAFTDTISMVETPFRKFGFSREALEFIFGAGKGYLGELLGSLMQVIGQQLHMNAHWDRTTRLLNRGGLVDPDALVRERGLRALAAKYTEALGDEWSIESRPIRYARRGVAAVRVAMDTGIGSPKNADESYATAKLQAPFSWNNQLMHRAVARQWLKTVEEAVNKAATYFAHHPAAASDPAFQFDVKSFQYASRGINGTLVDDRSFQYLAETLARNGISLEEAGRRVLRGEEALTQEQLHAILALAQTEVLLNAGVATRPGWALSTTVGRYASPIVGWSLYKVADLVKSGRDPRGKASARALASAALAFTLAVVPASLAYAAIRDWFDEEIAGKKANVLPLKWDETLPMALIDNLARVGTFGIAGDLLNSTVNVATSREFSIDSRVFFVSSLTNLFKTLGVVINQKGTVTYPTVVRPFLQSVGGSGYIANFDAINNLLELDNAERRVVRRINVSNQLRAAGRQMDLDVRTSRGITSMPNPVKPWIGQMALAAFANDPAGFREAYRKAVAAATKESAGTPKADPWADVAEYYERMHPLRSVFSKPPTKLEYQRLLLRMGDHAGEVAAAIRNFNSYGAQVKKGKGKEGIKPFYGTDRREAQSSYRSFAADFGGTPPTSDYRALVTQF